MWEIGTKFSMKIKPAASETGDPLLLTPGPLTTGKRVKEVMVHDWGSRDATFLKINSEVLTRLPEVVNGGADYVTVPMQGSGTFAVEAMLTTFVPADGHVLLLVNGAYGHRAKKILDIAKRKVTVHETPEDTPPDLVMVEQTLKDDASITHIFTVHCETTSGILNPIVALGALAQKYRKGYLIDSMSAFGALPLDASAIQPDAIAASSNKCIEGVPGLGFVICRKAALEKTAGNATTLVLDLHDQWQNLVRTGQYRFTPPIHVIVSFHQALKEFWAKHNQAERPLTAWYLAVSKAEWKAPSDVKEMFGASVDFVADNRIIFDIAGNKYRLIVHVAYPFKRVLIKFVGTHAEYDKIDPEKV